MIRLKLYFNLSFYVYFYLSYTNTSSSKIAYFQLIFFFLHQNILVSSWLHVRIRVEGVGAACNFFFNSPFLIIYIFKVKKVRQHTRLPVKSFHTIHRRDWLIKKKSSKYCRTSYLKYTLQSTKGIKHRISLATVLTMMAEEETEKFYLQSRSISKRVEPFLKILAWHFVYIVTYIWTISSYRCHYVALCCFFEFIFIVIVWTKLKTSLYVYNTFFFVRIIS